MNKIVIFLALSVSDWAFSQYIQKVYFGYDEGGNQIYRGELQSKNGNSDLKNTTELLPTTQISEKEFWNSIRIYPVPVKDILTIDWNENIDDIITDIGLYQQKTVHWAFQSKKIPSLNRKIQINMSQQYMGVYILTFTLKDGRRLSKNITKF